MEVIHDTQQQKFYCIIDGLESHMQYTRLGKARLKYYHTYVPPRLRNQGIARAIVTEAAKYALENKFSVIPTCSYVDAFFRRHPEYAEIVNHR